MRRSFAAFASSAAKVVVVGGSGFVGSAVCRAAVARGASVFSVSRGGEPTANQVAGSDWAKEVTWLKGDALKVSLPSLVPRPDPTRASLRPPRSAL